MAYNIYDLKKPKSKTTTTGTTQQLAADVAAREIDQNASLGPPKVDTGYAKYLTPSGPSLPGGVAPSAPTKPGTEQKPSGVKPTLETSTVLPTGGPTTFTPPQQPSGALPKPDSGMAPPPKTPEKLPGKPPEEPSMQELIDQAIRDMLQGGGETEEEQKARREQMAADEAKAIQSLRARTGLGGMGLTGAAGALESQLRTESARSKALTEAELERAAREEALRRAQIGIGAGQAEREMGIREEVYGLEKDLYEKELDRDIDGDGTVAGVPVSDTVGNADPSDNPEAVAAEEEAKPEQREGREGQLSFEQASTQMMDQYGVELQDVGWGTGWDTLAWNNTPVMTYDDPEWGIITVYQRPDGTYFKKLKKDLRG